MKNSGSLVTIHRVVVLKGTLQSTCKSGLLPPYNKKLQFLQKTLANSRYVY